MPASRPTDLTLRNGTANAVELTKTDKHSKAISDFRLFDSFTINFLSLFKVWLKSAILITLIQNIVKYGPTLSYS